MIRYSARLQLDTSRTGTDCNNGCLPEHRCETREFTIMSTIAEALHALADKKMVVVVDNEDDWLILRLR